MPRYDLSKLGRFREFSRNVWEIRKFWGSENYLLNNRSLFQFTYWSPFLHESDILEYKQNLFFGFEIFSFLAFFRPILADFGQKSEKIGFLAQNRPKNGQKAKNLKNPKNKFCLYSKMPLSCKKWASMGKLEESWSI